MIVSNRDLHANEHLFHIILQVGCVAQGLDYHLGTLGRLRMNSLRTIDIVFKIERLRCMYLLNSREIELRVI